MRSKKRSTGKRQEPKPLSEMTTQELASEAWRLTKLVRRTMRETEKELILLGKRFNIDLSASGLSKKQPRAKRKEK